MKIKLTRAPTITKAAIAAVVFTIVFLVTNSNLPPCSDAVAALNAGGCVVRQSYLHTACGWLALASLITGVVLFILKRRKASSKDQQAPPRQARSGAPRPAEATVSEVRTHGDGIGRVAASDGPSAFPGPERASNFCTQCGTRAVAADNFCQQCGAPVKDGTGSYPRTMSPATEAAR
jgi:hypothetical protein